MGDEAAVVALSFAHQDEKSVFVGAKLYNGAGLVVCEATLLEERRAQRKVGGGPCGARVVRSEFVFCIANLDRIDGTMDVGTSGGGIEGSARGVA